jgi:hypothetical protein
LLKTILPYQFHTLCGKGIRVQICLMVPNSVFKVVAAWFHCKIGPNMHLFYHTKVLKLRVLYFNPLVIKPLVCTCHCGAHTAEVLCHWFCFRACCIHIFSWQVEYIAQSYSFLMLQFWLDAVCSYAVVSLQRVCLLVHSFQCLQQQW